MNSFKDVVCVPEEWAKQSAVWFAWPCADKKLWKLSFETVRDQLIQLYCLSARFQTVNVLCSEKETTDLQARLKGCKTPYKINVLICQTDDVWIRDYGPIFLNQAHQSLIGTSWNFNAWGGKYGDFAKDNAVANWICRYLEIECQNYSEILEGGAIECNGEGLLCTTKSVLMNENRAGDFDSSNWDDVFANRLSVKKVLWFESGLAGDDTDGHIDNLIRFGPNKTVLVASTEDAEHVNYPPLKRLNADLESYLQSDLLGYQVVSVPIPDPIYFCDQIVAASYVNYLVLNDAVIVPSFNQQSDSIACAAIAQVYPDRAIIPFPCSEIIQEGGGLHCLSLNQPSLPAQEGK